MIFMIGIASERGLNLKLTSRQATVRMHPIASFASQGEASNEGDSAQRADQWACNALRTAKEVSHAGLTRLDPRSQALRRDTRFQSPKVS